MDLVKNKNFYIIIGVLAFTFIVFQSIEKTERPYVLLGGEKIRVEIASTPRAQARGLSGRLKLEEGAGMLFVFAESGRHSFWMKDMLFPIDIIWFDPDWRVIYFIPNAQPQFNPPLYTPPAAALYVLEVNAGFTDRQKIKEGDKAELKL